mmetsp:Transcript_101817/g.285381  ORF Transcript_101817/g.285381 Transcript_101817/m.285381 type:complete len:229 (+) Transcript_101817:705-1391(+)
MRPPSPAGARRSGRRSGSGDAAPGRWPRRSRTPRPWSGSEGASTATPPRTQRPRPWPGALWTRPAAAATPRGRPPSACLRHLPGRREPQRRMDSGADSEAARRPTPWTARRRSPWPAQSLRSRPIFRRAMQSASSAQQPASWGPPSATLVRWTSGAPTARSETQHVSTSSRGLFHRRRPRGASSAVFPSTAGATQCRPPPCCRSSVSGRSPHPTHATSPTPATRHRRR